MTTCNTTAALSSARGQGSTVEEALWTVIVPLLEPTSHERSGQRCVRSPRAFAVGDTVALFGAVAVRDRPSRMTVQVSEREHIELAPPSLTFINHSCEPNVHFDVERGRLVALRPIAAGEDIEFFYPSTEWVMASPFDCFCGSGRCIGRVAGASQVPPTELHGRPLAPHIVELLREAGRPVVAQ